MSEILNANPTIRNASDLPTRRGRTSSATPKTHTLGLFASSIPSSTYLSDPFEEAIPSSESDSDADDDNLVEPIDEQEIYGTRLLRSVPYPLQVTALTAFSKLVQI